MDERKEMQDKVGSYEATIEVKRSESEMKKNELTQKKKKTTPQARSVRFFFFNKPFLEFVVVSSVIRRRQRLFLQLGDLHVNMKERPTLKLRERVLLFVLRVHKVHHPLHRVESLRRGRHRRGKAVRVAVKDVHALLPLPRQRKREILIRRRHVVRDARVVTPPPGEVRRGLIRGRGGERGERGRGGRTVRTGSLDARWGVQRHATGGGRPHAHRGRQVAVSGAAAATGTGSTVTAAPVRIRTTG